jgi:glycerol-3-phosphate acyltransferase PlsY
MVVIEQALATGVGILLLLVLMLGLLVLAAWLLRLLCRIWSGRSTATSREDVPF